MDTAQLAVDGDRHAQDAASLQAGSRPSKIFRAGGMLISFKDLTYTVRSTHDKSLLNLLDSVSGYLRPSELVALMGPSGCGTIALCLGNVPLCRRWMPA